MEDGLFVAVGTSLDPFDRLLRILDELYEERRIPCPALAQSGHSRYVPRNYQAIAFMPDREMEQRVRRARAIVCHGGSGILGTCLLLGRRPVVFPRRAAHREIINDHQLELCQALLAQGRIYLAGDKAELSTGLERALGDRQGDRQPDRHPDRLPGARLKAAIADLLTGLATGRKKI